MITTLFEMQSESE